MNTNPEVIARLKVLVVDDETAILHTLKRILEHSGYEVQTAPSGREGLSVFQQGKWDLVTLDRSMPEMNGEEVAVEMRRMAPNVPLVLITGFPQAVLRPELFDAVLGKPFRPAELLQCFSQTLTKRRGRQQDPAASAGGVRLQLISLPRRWMPPQGYRDTYHPLNNRSFGQPGTYREPRNRGGSEHHRAGRTGWDGGFLLFSAV